jgi:antitoxin component YwqK of YwqJK toxin-antitoxin module
MTTIKNKITIFFITLSFLSCQNSNKVVIEKWDNGKIKIELVYSDTPSIFTKMEYYENGQLGNSIRFVDSLENGESISYYEDGRLLGTSNYRNGKRNGDVIEFYKSGNLMFKGYQIDDNLVGTAIHYYPDGKPETVIYYENKQSFLVNCWDSNNVQQVINGNGIKKFKTALNRYKNNEDTIIDVIVIGPYQDSLNNGIWEYYNIGDKKMILERNFKDNIIVSEAWK